jgi:four helix bundle protein
MAIPYEEWEFQVPAELRQDSLWKMDVYRLALYLYNLAWEDCGRLTKDRRGRAIADQLIRSAGSICANVEEGYGRGFGKQYAQFLRYSLGSARETRGWYYRGRKLLSPEVVQQRHDLLSKIVGLVVIALNQQKRSH